MKRDENCRRSPGCSDATAKDNLALRRLFFLPENVESVTHFMGWPMKKNPNWSDANTEKSADVTFLVIQNDNDSVGETLANFDKCFCKPSIADFS